MTSFTAAGYLSNAARTEAEQKQAFEDNLAATKQLLGAAAPTTLTLVSDQITPTQAFHLVETQGAAATDNCAQVLQTNLPDGSWLVLGVFNASHVVTFKHAAGGTGQLNLAGGVDFAIDDLTTFVILQREGTVWKERGRNYGADTAAMRSFYGLAGLAQNTFTGRQEWKKGADLTAAATLTLGTDGNMFHVTGSTTINGISAAPAGTVIRLVFDAALLLTFNVTSLILNPRATRMTIAGEVATFVSEGGGNWREANSSTTWAPIVTLDRSGGGSATGAVGATTIYSTTVPAYTLNAASVGTNRRLRLTGHGFNQWQAGGGAAGDTCRFRLFFGGSLAGAVIIPSPNVAGAGTAFTNFEASIDSVASPTTQTARLHVATCDIAGGTPGTVMIGGGGLGVNTLVAQSLAVEVLITASGSSASVSFSLEQILLEWL